MPKPLALITERLDDACAAWLAERAQVEWCSYKDAAALADALPHADALIVRTYTQVNDAMLAAAPKLKVVGRAGVGLDNIDIDACRKRHVPVVYTPDANSQAVVEYVLGLMLDAVRPRVAMPDGVSDDAFNAMREEHVGVQLDQLTLGILGFGRIGKRLGAVAHTLGMNLMVNDLLPEAEFRKAVDYPFSFVAKSDLYALSDIISIHVDGRAANRAMLDAAALSQLKPTCLLINTSRGMVIDVAALAEWARRVAPTGGRAALDVHDPEPPPADYPLYGLPNVRLLPHLASRTTTALANMSWVVRDVATVLEGGEPEWPAW